MGAEMSGEEVTDGERRDAQTKSLRNLVLQLVRAPAGHGAWRFLEPAEDRAGLGLGEFADPKPVAQEELEPVVHAKRRSPARRGVSAGMTRRTLEQRTVAATAG